MVNCLLKEADLSIETSQGLFFIDKPKIKTRFCFGYDSQGRGLKSAYELAHKAEKDVEYFKKENLKELNENIQLLKSEKEIYCNNYYGSGKSNIKSWSCNSKNWIKGTPEVVTEETRTLLIEMYEEELKSLSKRLDTYLKKYGLSKIYTWTYCAD